MSHTPGPWRAGKDNYGGIVADHPIEGGVMGTDDVEHYGGYLIAETVAPCNKPIIAAAPELLEALKQARRRWLDAARALEYWTPQEKDDLRRTDAAIDKATGGAR